MKSNDTSSGGVTDAPRRRVDPPRYIVMEALRHLPDVISFLSRDAIGYLRDLFSLYRSIDRAAFSGMRQRLSQRELGYRKYLQLDFMLPYNLYRYYTMELQRPRPGMRVLDIGTGGGYFPMICKHFGYDVQTLDVDTWEIFNEMTRFFGLERAVHRVRAFEPIPAFEDRFDVITALQTTFNLPSKDEVWNSREWEFFLDDLRDNHLRSGGVIHVDLNRASKYEAHYDQELLDFFVAQKASIDGGKLIFR